MSNNDFSTTATTSTSWVKDLHIEKVSSSPSKNDDLHISVASFNILAEAYLTPRSHKNLPAEYQEVVFDPRRRRRLLCDTLKHLAEKFEVICLQELDTALWDDVVSCFADLGYDFVHAYRSGKTHATSTKNGSINANTTARDNKSGNRKKREESRPDGCAIFYCVKKWECTSFQAVQFNDLTQDNGKLNGNNDTSHISSSSHALCGIIDSYIRHNTALIVALQSVVKPDVSVIVTNMHLYWNPAYEYVKLSQAHYMMKRVKAFADARFGLDSAHVPVIICGDTNSKPNSIVHQYLTKGVVDARQVAPWHYHYSEDDEGGAYEFVDSTEKVNENDCQDAVDKKDKRGESLVLDSHSQQNQCSVQQTSDMLERTHLDSDAEYHTSDPQLPGGAEIDSKKDTPEVRYMLDSTLNKFTRWLRILGLDAELETREEESMRTSKNANKMTIFERAKEETRSIITTSYRLIVRKDCPPGAYLVNQRGMRNFEEVLVHLLRLHGTTIYVEKVLSRCVICNGCIIEVEDPQRKKAIFEQYGSPDFSQSEVYECNKCFQGYWWCDEPTSSASRVKESAAALIRLCMQGGIPVVGKTDFFGTFDMEDIAGNSGENFGKIASTTSRGENTIDEVVSWLREERLTSAYGSLKSAYALDVGEGEHIPFTNVTSDFVDVLDYILFDPAMLVQEGYLAIPTSFKRLNGKGMKNGHLLPSNEWPSDHLAIGATFRVLSRKDQTV